MKPRKKFKYDILIGPEDLCNRIKERRALLKAAREGKRIILFAPRRYGKTSLVRNIVGTDFEKISKKHLLLSFDFMDVSSLESIEERLHAGLTKALAERFSVKKLMNDVVNYLKGFTVHMTQHPATGRPSLQLRSERKEVQKNIYDFFQSIHELSKHYKTMIVLDEFHDISFVDEAEALFRMFLQELDQSSVFILGSKRHLLQLMFQDANAPLFHYGDEMYLETIELTDWLPYFKERLEPQQIKMKTEALAYLIEQMNHVPNAICEAGEWIRENTPAKSVVSVPEIIAHLDDLVNRKQSFAYLLQAYTEKERNVLKALSKYKFVKEPGSEGFLKEVDIAKSTVFSIMKKLIDKGSVEVEMDKGYRISDPILGYYLSKL